MGGFSLWHWLILIVWLIVLGYPVARILRRTGHSTWWVIAFLIPLNNLVSLWVLAFARWPRVPERLDV